MKHKNKDDIKIKAKTKSQSKFNKIAKRILLCLIPLALAGILVIGMKTDVFAAEGEFDLDGTGTLVAYSESNGKEFFTIVTGKGNVFYIIIDRECEINNVYFLNSVTEDDLIPFVTRDISEILNPTTTQPPETNPPTDNETSGSKVFFADNMALLALGAIALIGGGVFLFTKMKKKKAGTGKNDNNFNQKLNAPKDDFDDEDDE